MAMYLLLICIAFGGAHARGPHHPRGEPIARHHVHYRPTKGTGEQNLIQDAQLLHDKEHIQEHLEEVIEEPDLSNLTDEELEFYYFQVHDVDKNSKLDGLEILQAIQHTTHKNDHEHDGDEPEVENATTEDNFNYYIELIDKVLEEDDVDHDGYLSYPEFVAGRKKESAANIQPVVQMIK